MLGLSCEHLDRPNGSLTRIESDTQQVEHAVATHSQLQPGESCPVGQAYRKQTMTLERPSPVVDPGAEVDNPGAVGQFARDVRCSPARG